MNVNEKIRNNMLVKSQAKTKRKEKVIYVHNFLTFYATMFKRKNNPDYVNLFIPVYALSIIHNNRMWQASVKLSLEVFF